MSKHNKNRQKKFQHKKARAVVDHAGNPLRLVHRVVISQTYERMTSVEQWVLVNTNLDCGGMPESDAAKVCYNTAAVVMKKLAEVNGATDATKPVDVGGEASAVGRDSGQTAGQQAEGGEVEQVPIVAKECCDEAILQSVSAPDTGR